MIRFRVNLQPVAKGRPRFASRGNFAVAYTDAKTREAETNFAAQAVKYRPERPLEGPIKLNLVFASIRPKSKSKKIVHWTTRPDLDNFVKLVKDALNKIFWRDDSQIVELNARKVYGDGWYTEVEIRELPNIENQEDSAK